MNGNRIERAVPDFAEFFKSQRTAETFADVEVPVVGRNAALLPIVPARIFFNRRPEFVADKEMPRESLDRPRQVSASTRPMPEDGGLKRRVGMVSADDRREEAAVAGVFLPRKAMIAGRIETSNTTATTQ